MTRCKKGVGKVRKRRIYWSLSWPYSQDSTKRYWQWLELTRETTLWIGRLVLWILWCVDVGYGRLQSLTFACRDDC
jgi:hypothetical protein